ncbi:VAN3-binding protein [Carex littledalei]|uniref:VAN3-binding protein n=1 Tax=Carex littledalei TaxID=544730 RepID=A0A833QLB4_9POAL|nr:VAN3-binding protein [Carex littledalei]
MEEARDVFPWRTTSTEIKDPMEFLSRSWSASALEVSKERKTPTTLPHLDLLPPQAEDPAGEVDESPAIAGNTFSFASSTTSQLVMERIMSQSEVSPLTSGRLSHSSGPLNGGSLTDSPPVSPSEIDDLKYCRAGATPKPQNYRAANKTVGRWLKDRKERKKEETRAHNAQLHAAVSVAAVAAAVAAVAAATAASASGSGKDDKAARTDMAVASAATLVAAQCVEAAEAMGAERDHLAAVVGSAVNVRTPGDITTITAAAATALRGAATLKARALKEVWNIAAVIPVEKGVVGPGGAHHNKQQQQQRRLSKALKEVESNGSSLSDELPLEEENFLGALHWKVVSVYINRLGLVMLKMKSKHVAGTITKKKKSVIVDVCKDVSAWPGRHLLEGGEQRRYFGLRTAERRVIEFECRSSREFEMWTQGVSRLLSIVNERKRIG